MKCKPHCTVFDSHEFAICQRGCRVDAERLSCKATFSEEIARIQYGYRDFLAVLRDEVELYFALLDVKNRIARCASSFFPAQFFYTTTLKRRGKFVCRFVPSATYEIRQHSLTPYNAVVPQENSESHTNKATKRLYAVIGITMRQPARRAAASYERVKKLPVAFPTHCWVSSFAEVMLLKFLVMSTECDDE